MHKGKESTLELGSSEQLNVVLGQQQDILNLSDDSVESLDLIKDQLYAEHQAANDWIHLSYNS